ncbi:hypothetical protein DPMN_004779 [Dreissena polymorpha]|uniref:Uncharacterized protein n=1 Tax=Dreissena polymorpha TaxID=45954 RepID=A0A9D4MTA1_DREPO|nr:hypothetical protein DPMN_004779 [Dreissena polymorpha]
MEESSAAVQVYALESATACTQRVKDCNAELKTHHAQSDVSAMITIHVIPSTCFTNESLSFLLIFMFS